MTCFSFGSGLWLSEIWEASLPLYPPYLQIHQKEAIRSRMEKERRIKRPWWGMKHNERSERSPEELTKFLFKNFIKPPDWWLNKGVVSGTLQAILTFNRQRWGWCYKPHRSKVKRCEQGQLIQNKGKNTRFFLFWLGFGSFFDSFFFQVLFWVLWAVMRWTWASVQDF